MIDAGHIGKFDRDQLLDAVIGYPYSVPLSVQFVVRIRHPFEPRSRPVVIDVRRLPAQS